MKTIGQALGIKTEPVMTFQSYSARGTVLRSGFQTWNLDGAKATVEVGAQRRGVTAARVAAVGVLALAVKKDKTKVFVTVELASGEQIVIESPSSREPQARKFAAFINSIK
jgi:hypothetical protein